MENDTGSRDDSPADLILVRHHGSSCEIRLDRRSADENRVRWFDEMVGRVMGVVEEGMKK